MYKFSLACIFIASCLLVSCDNKEVVFSKYQPIQDEVWDKQSEYFFSFEIADNSIPYNISLLLRHSDNYPYQNLWILFEELQPSKTSVKDTIEWLLADDFGKWTGNGITLFQNQFAHKKNYHFPDTGTYTITMRHGMRDDSLKGIEDIGLLIEKANF